MRPRQFHSVCVLNQLKPSAFNYKLRYLITLCKAEKAQSVKCSQFYTEHTMSPCTCVATIHINNIYAVIALTHDSMRALTEFESSTIRKEKTVMESRINSIILIIFTNFPR